jgi:hypothetical protein
MSTPPPLPPAKKTSTWIFYAIGAGALVLLGWLVFRSPAEHFESPKEQFPAHPVRLQLSQADHDYYAEVSRLAVSPTVVMSVEQELSQRFDHAETLIERNAVYAAVMNICAQKIAAVPRAGVDRRLVKAAADYRLRRLDEAQLVAQLTLPDLKTAGVKLLFEFLMAMAPDAQGNSRPAEEAFKGTLVKGLSGAADTAKTMVNTAESVRQLEVGVMEAHTQLLKSLSSEESIGIPSYFDSVQVAIAKLEESSRKNLPKLDKGALATGLIGRRSAKMNFDFEPGEIREFQVISQEVRGHCVVSTVKLSVISRFLQEKKEGQIRLVHSMLPDAGPELLYAE